MGQRENVCVPPPPPPPELGPGPRAESAPLLTHLPPSGRARHAFRERGDGGAQGDEARRGHQHVITVSEANNRKCSDRSTALGFAHGAEKYQKERRKEENNNSCPGTKTSQDSLLRKLSPLTSLLQSPTVPVRALARAGRRPAGPWALGPACGRLAGKRGLRRPLHRELRAHRPWPSVTPTRDKRPSNQNPRHLTRTTDVAWGREGGARSQRASAYPTTWLPSGVRADTPRPSERPRATSLRRQAALMHSGGDHTVVYLCLTVGPGQTAGTELLHLPSPPCNVIQPNIFTYTHSRFP